MGPLVSALKHSLPHVAFCFLGFGFFRAWTEAIYLSPIRPFPIQSAASPVVFDVLTAIVLIVMAASSRHLAPLHSHARLVPLTVVLLMLCTCANFASLAWNLPAPAAGPIDLCAMAAGAFGTALALMLWSELLACLNPLQIALYFSASIMCGCAISWLLNGMAVAQSWVCVCLLPVVFAKCLKKAYEHIPKADLPQPPTDRFSFPWKPVVVVALFNFALSFILQYTGSNTGVNANPGAFLGALVVFCGIALRRGNFDFSLLWKIGIPTVLVALVPIGVFAPSLRWLAGVAATAGASLFLVLMMVILGNMSYRYGMCALWLFSIERAVRLLFGQAGALAGVALTSQLLPRGELGVLFATSSAILALVTALIFASEKSLSSMWGIVLKDGASEDGNERLRRSRLGIRCRSVAAENSLTEREEETLFQLLQGKRPARIADELGVELSTVRTHIKHIYQKLGVHSNKELMEHVGVRR